MDLFPSAESVTPARGPTIPTSSSSRHLKRLSLGQFPSPSPSLGSVGSPHGSLVNSPAPSGPSTPTIAGAQGSARRSHTPRHLRLSMSGSSSSLGYTNSPTTATPERGEYHNGGLLSPTSPTLRPGPLSRSNSARAIRTQHHSPNLNGPTATESPSSASGLNRSRSMGHSRGLSSISYSSSSNLARPTSIDGPAAVGAGHASPSPAGVRRFEGSASPSFGSTSSLVGVEEAEVEDEEAEKRRVNEERASMAAASQPTLIEANVDLLSFIAKKERKCLDLREELKRHEGELAVLKKKWESIVAKSVASGSGASGPPPRAISPTNRFSLSLPRSIPGRSPTPSAHSDHSPRGSPAPPHAMDLSLLASTFDASGGDDHAAHDGVDLNAGLDSAKAWMGSLVGKIADVVTTLEESFDGGQDAARLDVLAEEDEGEGDSAKGGASRSGAGHGRGEGGHQSEASVSSVDEKRVSRASSASIESTSSFGFSNGNGLATPAPVNEFGQIDATPSPTLTRSALAGPPLSHSARSRPSPDPSPNTLSQSQSHARSRSVFDLASSVTASGWTSFGKRLSAAANSDAFRHATARATTLVETFESGLVSALGPLEGDLPPVQGGEVTAGAGEERAAGRAAGRARGSLGAGGGSSEGVGLGVSAGPGMGLAGWTRTRTSSGSGSGSPEAGRDPEKTPRLEDGFGREGLGGDAAVGAANKLGGYRRPSASGSATSPATKMKVLPARDPERDANDDEGDSWAAW